MLDTTLLDKIFKKSGLANKKFEPEYVDLRADNQFDTNVKEVYSEDKNFVNVEKAQIKPKSISPENLQKRIIAIDATSTKLGIIEDGLLGVVRISTIIREINEKNHRLERYGPKLVDITNQNKYERYKKLYQIVFGDGSPPSVAPDNSEMLDRIRNLYEKYIQISAIKSNQDSLILIDGSLIGGTVDTPKKIINEMIMETQKNNNTLIAISKKTGLTLKNSGKSILSLIDNQVSPIFLGPLNSYLEVRNAKKYLGEIYVAKLSTHGESFRIDIPPNLDEDVNRIFNQLASTCGYYGYPEELKFAHTTCIHSHVEMLALQAFAIQKYKMGIEKNIRNLIFPL